MSISFNDDGFGRKVGAITSNWKSDGNMKALKKTMEQAFQRSQDKVRVKSGKLKNSGKVSVTKEKGAITYSEFYAQFVEFRVEAYLRPAMNPAKIRKDLRKNTADELKDIINKNK
jgi:hypothetical protein